MVESVSLIFSRITQTSCSSVDFLEQHDVIIVTYSINSLTNFTRLCIKFILYTMKLI